MKKFIKKLATHCVTLYAEKIYKQAVTLAEDRHKETHKEIFVITRPDKPSHLMTLTKEEFLDLRHKFKIPSRALPVSSVRNNSWYHTANLKGLDALTEEEIEIRKLAFVRELLIRAKLV